MWLMKMKGHSTRQDLNAAVLEFLVAQGMKDAAVAFRDEAGLSVDLDVDSIERRREIVEKIQKGEIPEMLDTLPIEDERVAFELNNQALIEFIRRGETMRALSHARNHMRTILNSESDVNEERRSRLERSMGLLAFENPETSSPDSSLFDQCERDRVASLVNRTLLQREPKLCKLMKLMNWTQHQILQVSKHLPVKFNPEADSLSDCWVGMNGYSCGGSGNSSSGGGGSSSSSSSSSSGGGDKNVIGNEDEDDDDDDDDDNDESEKMDDDDDDDSVEVARRLVNFTSTVVGLSRSSSSTNNNTT